MDDRQLPIDPNTGEAILPQEQPGYYPGYSTLSQRDHWDPATREKIMKRVQEVSEPRFFSESECLTMQAVLERILPQSDRVPERRIPLLNMIDERLYEKRFEGYIFEGMPEEDVAHRMGLQAIEEMALFLHNKIFAKLSPEQQEGLLISIQRDDPVPAHPIWKKLSAAHYWGLLIQGAVSAYYTHPYAWDEIGFGGPAYPRGYMRLTHGLAESWEVPEKRYEWRAPEFTRSDEFQENSEIFTKSTRHGQAGTH